MMEHFGVQVRSKCPRNWGVWAWQTGTTGAQPTKIDVRNTNPDSANKKLENHHQFNRHSKMIIPAMNR